MSVSSDLVVLSGEMEKSTTSKFLNAITENYKDIREEMMQPGESNT